MRIGFIGVGNMGGPMARNLLSNGYDVLAFDAVAVNVEQLAALGARIAPSLAQLAADVTTVITMLPSGNEVRSVLIGDDGVLREMRPGSLVIDCSTTDVETARLVARSAEERGIDFIDCPVSGGVSGAQSASLTFMAGGAPHAIERARPILEATGKTLIHVGSVGAGQAAKICNNLILGISMIGICEAFALAERLGLAADKLFEVSANSSGQCWSLTSYCPVPGLVAAAPSNRDYAPGFSSRMMLKDLRLASEAAEAVGCQLALGQVARRIYEDFVQSGGGNVDFSGIFRVLRER